MWRELYNRNPGEMIQVLFLLLAVSSARALSEWDIRFGMQEVLMPGEYRQCPIGQSFCFMSGQCVNSVDSSCPEIPNCLPIQEELCSVEGFLECVPTGSCNKVQVKFKLETTYDAVVGTDHAREAAFKDNLRQKLADKLGLTKSEVWGVRIHADASSVWIEVSSVPGAYDSWQSIFQVGEQFLVDQDGKDLIINFAADTSITKEYGDQGDGTSAGHGDGSMDDVGDHCPFGECTICGPGEVFCIDHGACVPEGPEICEQDDNGDEDWNEDWEHCPGCMQCGPGMVFCIDHGACVPDGPETCEQDENGDEDWNEDWEHCPECMTCSPGMVFCIDHGACVPDGPETCEQDENFEEDWNEDREHCPGCMTCGPGTVFCIDHGACVPDGPETCEQDENFEEDWNEDREHCPGCITCGPGMVFCIVQDACVPAEQETCPPDGNDDDDWDDDWDNGGDHCPDCMTCEPGKVFCIDQHACVPAEQETCPPDGNDDDDWGDDWDKGGDHCPDCMTCEPGKVFCIDQDACVPAEQETCPPDGNDDDDWGDDWDNGGDHCPDCMTCEPGKVFCIDQHACVPAEQETCPPDGNDDDDWGDDWDKGGDHCSDCMTCEPGKVFCIDQDACVPAEQETCPPDGNDDDDWGDDWDNVGDHCPDCMTCEPGKVFCIDQHACVPAEQETCPPDGNDDDDWGDDWDNGGDHCPDCMTCEPGKVFCIDQHACVPAEQETCPPDGNDDDDWGDDWDNGGDHCPDCMTCEPGKVFCIDQDACVPAEQETCPPDGNDDDDWDDEWDNGGDHCPDCMTCEPGKVFCIDQHACVPAEQETCPPDGNDDDDWGDDWDNGGDHCPDCMTCEPGKIFCLDSKECRSPETICSPDECEEQCVDPHSGQYYCTTEGECDTSSIKVSFALNGDIGSIGDIEVFKDSLRTVLASQLNIDAAVLNIMDISGSIDINMELNSASPDDLNSALESLKELVENGGTLHIGGMDYPTMPASLFIGGTAYNIVACLEPKTRRYKMKQSLSTLSWSILSFLIYSYVDATADANAEKICSRYPSKCFPSKTAGQCPDVTAGPCANRKFQCGKSQPCSRRKICCGSPCGTTCELPKVETEEHGTCPAADSDKFIGTCSNVCSGGACGDGMACCYSNICNTEVCVQKEGSTGDGTDSEKPDSGSTCLAADNCKQCAAGQTFCLMSGQCEDIANICDETDDSCTDGKIWCEEENMCTLENECGPPPPVPDPDMFFISFKPEAPFDYFATEGIRVTTETVKAEFGKLEENIQDQLEEFFAQIPAEMNWISALPTLTGEDDMGVIVWVKFSADKDSLTLSDLESKLDELTLTNVDGEVMNSIATAYKVPVDPNYTFFLPIPLVSGEEREVDIRALIPDAMRDELPETLRDSFPTQTTLDCATEHKVFFINPETSENVRSITVDGSASTVTIVHSDENIKRVECAITFQDLQDLAVTTNYQLGLILIPGTMAEIARVESVTLVTSQMEIEEDAECQFLPDPLFEKTVGGDSLINKLHNWPRRMIDSGEVWVAQDLSESMQSVLADFVIKRRFSLKQARNANVGISEETRYYENKLVAKFQVLGDSLDSYLNPNGGNADLLATREKLKLCVAGDFNGNFTIEITPVVLNTEYDILTISVQVNPVNDAPVARDDIDQIKEELSIAYPQVGAGGAKSLVISAAELARAFFSDMKDNNEDVLMALLGYRNPYNGIEGTWEYRSSATSDWVSVPEYTPFAEGIDETSVDIEVPVVTLPKSAELKFTPSSGFEDVTWKRSEVPSIFFMGLDVGAVAEPSESTSVILNFCDAGSGKLCGSGGTSQYSEPIIEWKLPRMGCDNVINSGIERLNEACECGVASCPDCNGIDGGDADFDECGLCSSPSEMLTSEQCCMEEFLDRRDEYLADICAEEDELEEEIDNKCQGEPGTVLNECGLCVPDGSDLSGYDLCDIFCGDNTCLDCLSVPHGNAKLNPCGDCRNQENFYEGCVGMGRVTPEFDYVWPTSNIWLAVTETLSVTSITNIQCQLSAVGGVNSIVVPEVTAVEFDSDATTAATAGNRIKLTVSVSEAEAQNSAGEFDITCTFDESPVSISDNRYYNRFGHPTLLTITPAEALLEEVTTATLTVSELTTGNTGKVYCVTPCGDFNSYCRSSADGQLYYTTNGKKVNETTITCSLFFVQKARKAQVIKLNAILGEPENIDMASLPSPLEFIVKMPAPTMVSADTDEWGCDIIYIKFDSFITAPSGIVCGDIFTISDYTFTSDVSCTVKGREIVMQFSSGVSMLTAGTVLSLVDNVIRAENVDTDDERTIAYSTGSVTLAATDIKQPIVSIHGTSEIGLQVEYIDTSIQNSRCLLLDFTWTVEAVGTDTPSAEVSEKIAALNQRFGSLVNERWFDIQAAEFVSGETFQFLLSWSAVGHNDISGTARHNITRDDSRLITTKIEGIKGEVDTTGSLKLFAQVNMNVDQLTNTGEEFQYEWTISPPPLEPKPKPTNRQRLSIAANTLEPEMTYTGTFKVSYGPLSAEDTIQFTTKPRPLVVTINGNNEGQISVPANEDLTLTAVASEVTDTSDVFIWKCETNQNSEDPEDDSTFETCLEKDQGSNKMVPVKRYGETIILPAANRNTDKSYLRQRWSVSWRRNGQVASAEKMIKFIAVPKVPRIKLKKKEIKVGPKTKRVRVWAWCKADDGHIWKSAEDYPYFDVAAVAKYPGREVDVTYTRATKKLRRCSILLDFTTEDAQYFIDGSDYMLVINAYSEYTDSDGRTRYVENTATVKIKTSIPPIAGTLEVSPVDPSLTTIQAMKSEIQIRAVDWWDPVDDTDLKYLFYYRQSGSKWEKINTRFEPAEKKTIVLPEGFYEFRVACRNSHKLKTVLVSDDTITVEPIDMVEEATSMTVIQKALLEIQTAVDNAVNTLARLMRYAESMKDQASEEYVTEVKAVVSLQISTVVKLTLPTEEEDSDPDDTITTLRSTTELIQEHDKPEEVDASARRAMLLAAMKAARQKTGNTGSSSRRRKKRETVEYSESDASGMSKEEAEVMLQLISTLGMDPDFLTKEEAIMLMELLDETLIGLCQAYDGDGTEPSDAVVPKLSVRLNKQSVDASSSTDVVSPVNYTNPVASINIGSELESMYGDLWNCSDETELCEDVCIATAQMAIDFITKSAASETFAPARESDIVILKLINPETHKEEVVEDQVDTVFTVQTTASNLTDFDLLCMMWVSDANWKSDPCTTGEPYMSGSYYAVECACNQLGFLGVFQTEKQNTTGQTTSTVASSSTTTAPTSTQKPAINLQSRTYAVRTSLTLSEVYTIQIDRFTLAVLISHLRQEMAQQLGYNEDLFRDFTLKEGSIIISFDLYPSSTPGHDSLGQMLANIQNMVQSGTLTLTNPDGETLTVMTNSFSYVEQTTDVDDGKEDTSDPLPGILGGVFGALAGIGVCATIVIIYMKKYHGKRARLNDSLTPPHSPTPVEVNDKATPFPIYHTHAPPPFSAFIAPSKDKLYPEVNKWTENELKLKVESPREELKLPRDRSAGSASSLERRLRQNLEDRQPTPVDS